MTQISRDFKGIWIPREIWLRKDISALERSLWAEIHSLYDCEEGGCYASNEYLCEFFDVKERRLQEMISNLKEKGLIVQISFNGRKRVLKAIEPKESQETRTSEVQKSAPLGCGKMHPLDAEKCGSHNIYRTKSISKNNDVEKTQKKNVVVSSLVQEIEGITSDDKKALSKFSDDRIKLALEYNAQVKPIQSKIQQLMWHCSLDKPIVSSKIKKNSLYEEFKNWSLYNQSDKCKLEINEDSATFIHNGQGLPITIKFLDADARKRISELTKGYEFYTTRIVLKDKK
jgi:hypothetical protein